MLNRAFFTRIYIDESDGALYVTGDELTVMVQPLIAVQRSHGEAPGDGDGRVSRTGDAATVIPKVLLAKALENVGSSKSAMVGRVGLEPTTQGL